MAILPVRVFSYPLPFTSDAFQSPIDFEISLAGNFGEPRPHHFHGGLDIRTAGVEGKHVYAIADGYVSRITVGKDGFGYAIYITHPTGHTSVYCHLKQFSPRIKAALRRYQYSHHTSEADARLTPLDVPVSRGQLIALSGNTGHSTAPHLHLEVHDTRTGNMLDPYSMLNDCIQDSVPPQLHGVMAIPLGGTFGGSTQPSTFDPQNALLTAWGKVGFAAWADDYMQGAYNHYGVSETLLYADGQTVFHSLVDNIPVSLNRMVNSWGCYDYWLHHRRWYMKSYIEPGNTLSCLQANKEHGVIDFNEQRDYLLEYVLRDFKGNESHYTCTIHAMPPSAVKQSGQNTAKQPLLRWNRTNSYSMPGMQLVVPYGLVTTHRALQPRHLRQQGAWSDVYQFSSVSLPLMADAWLSIYAHRQASDNVVDHFDPTKLYITNEQGRYLGGDFNNGWVTGRIRELGSSYRLAYDDVPPSITPIALNGHRLLLNITDGSSGIASWTATVDGRFIVFDAIEKTTTYACELRESWLQPQQREHHLHFEATDNRRNTQAYDVAFTY